MYSMISVRSPEFYSVVFIILILLWFVAMRKQQEHTFKNNLVQGCVRGAVTGVILGGLPGIVPTTVMLSFVNVLTHELGEIITGFWN